MEPDPYEENGKWGLRMATGRIVCAPIYDGMDSFSEGLARVVVGNKEGFIDTFGEVVVPIKFERVAAYSEGLAIFGEGWIENRLTRWGYLDSSGNVAIEAKFEDVRKFSGGLAAATIGGRMRNGRTGYIDRKGDWCIPPRFTWADDFSEGFAVIEEESGRSVIDNRGHYLVVPDTFEMIAKFSEGLARVSLKGKWGFINPQGEVAIPLVYDLAYDFINGHAVAMKDQVSGILSPDGVFEQMHD